MMQISPQFKRALESEIRRLMEQRKPQAQAGAERWAKKNYGEARISPKFKEALRQELKRQMEARPVFGQGGAAGAGIRRLDQQLRQVNQQHTRMDANVNQLIKQYSSISTRLEIQNPKEHQRINAILDELEQALKHLDAAGRSIQDAISL